MTGYLMKHFQIIILVLLCFLFLNDPAWTQEMGGRALLIFQETQIDETETTNFGQLYELRFQKDVSSALQYRVYIRWEGDWAKTKQEDSTQKSRVQLLQPTLDIILNFSPFEFRTTLDLQRINTKPSPGEGHLLEQKRFLNQFGWRPEGLPNLVILLDRKMEEDKKSKIDKNDTILYNTLDYSYKAFKLYYNFRFEDFNDKAIKFTRNDYEHQGRVDYQDNFFSNRLIITGSYLIDSLSRISKATGGTSITIPIEIIPQRGLYSNDPTPIPDDIDFPLVDTPTLIDRNLSLSTGINIGSPGGLDSQNIGVNLGSAKAANQIYIYVRNATGGLVPSGGLITWDVYTSANGIQWALQAAAASTIFNTTFSRYEITFPFPITPFQYYKVVNTGINTIETLVTEIQIFSQTTFAPGEKRTETIFTQTGNLNITTNPLEKVTLSYDGYFNISKNDTENQPTSRSIDWTQGLTAQWNPIQIFNTTLRYQTRRSETETQDQTSDFYSAVLDFPLLRTLDITFSASQTSEETNGDKTNLSRTFLLHNSAKLYKDWDVYLDFGYTWQKNFTESLLTKTYNITSSSYAQLTKNLSWTLNGTASWISTSRLIDRRTKSEQVTSEFFYRPSRQISLNARMGYLWGEKQSGLIHSYKLDWMPFPDGAIQFTGLYELGRDLVSSQSADRVIGTIRWNINRYAYLECNYSRVVSKVTETSRAQSFNTQFNITF